MNVSTLILRGRVCYAGLFLASRLKTMAYVMFCPQDWYIIFFWFYGHLLYSIAPWKRVKFFFYLKPFCINIYKKNMWIILSLRNLITYVYMWIFGHECILKKNCKYLVLDSKEESKFSIKWWVNIPVLVKFWIYFLS